MAGLESSTAVPYFTATTSERIRSPTQVLPNGPCNHRDTNGICGCDQFWDKTSADLHEGSKEHRPNSERSTWCVCGHHACMHAREARPPIETRRPSATSAGHRAHLRCDARCPSQPGSQCNCRLGVHAIEKQVAPQDRSQLANCARLKTSPAESNQLTVRQAASLTNGPSANDEARNLLSQANSSGLLPVPSMCFLSQDKRPRNDYEARGHASSSRQTITGLGLSMSYGNMGIAIDRPQSATSTVPDDINISKPHAGSFAQLDIPSTRENSVLLENSRVNSPGLSNLDQILQFNHHLDLATGGDTIPNTYNPDEFIQSATELATPSIANTPNLGQFDQAVQDTRTIVDDLRRLASVQQGDNPESRTNIQEQLQQAFMSASPRTIQHIISYLQPIHTFLSSLPNMTHALRELHDRIDIFENSSFNNVQTEDQQRQFEMCEGRIIDLEHRMDDHDRLHQTIDADHSTSSFTRRRIANINESFGSHHSIHSVATLDHHELHTKVEDVEDRLSLLEAAALPTSINPWDVEIVFLPWGRELRGIWFAPDEPMHDHSKAITQESEEWTQIRSLKSPSIHQRTSQGPERTIQSSPAPNARPSLASSMPFSDAESGWSSQAISEWASGPTDEWLSPKACGCKNKSYQRLRSRGFVKAVTLRNANAGDIQTTLLNAFKDLPVHLKYTNQDEDPIISSYPGLRASFIPLRKVQKDSKLCFLAPSEMASSALWGAQFLASGVIMRAPGGTKRLYVTQREAYIQQSEGFGSWTWPELRLLPRYQMDLDSQMEGNEEQCQPQVAEADARESCWSFDENYDTLPPSVNSSFSNSHHLAQIAMRPADQNWRRSITPSSVLKNKQPHPISPLSEFHPLRPSQGRLRTVSAPQIETNPQGSAKRRFNASPVKHSSVPQVSSRTPSVSLVRQKRRRIAPSSSPGPHIDQSEGHDAAVPIWANTPRRSREPPSPLLSSHPQLPRTNSDVASRVGKGTPLAYATPYSGPCVESVEFGEGDTEPDSDNYEDEEASWRGVEDDENIEAGVDEPASFSGDESGFASEDDAGAVDDDDDDDDGEADDESIFCAQHCTASEDGDVFDRLLDVLQSQ